MNDPQTDSFLSPASFEQAELKVKGSRFIASIDPIVSEQEAFDVIRRVTLDYSDATHHCFAFKLGSGDHTRFRCSDAGEPSGTAGSAILSAIDHKGLTNVVLMVTRYFGGTKLGIGPLRRAYRDSAKAVIEKCGSKTGYYTRRFSLRIPYSSLKEVERILKTVEAEVVSQEFDEDVKFIVDVRKSRAEEFQKKIKHITKGEGPKSI